MSFGDPRRTLLRHAALQTALWALLAALAVHLSTVLHARLDLTRDGRYGLSQVAIDTVAALERPLLARVFFSEGLDPPYHDHRRALLDLLDELAARSGGRMEVLATDPTGDPELRAEAQRLGVRPIPYMGRPSDDRTETRTIYMGLALVYGEQRIAIDAMPSIERMEVEVVSAIRRLATPAEERKTVAWLLGHGEPDPATFPSEHPLQAFARRVRDAATFRTLALGDAPVPDDVDVVVLVAPRRPLSGAEQVHLDQHLMRGGRLLAFVSTVQPEPPRVVEVPHGLYGWLGSYGVVLGRSVVLDRTTNERLTVPVPLSGGGSAMYALPHPLAVVTRDLDHTLSPVRGLPRLVLPFASPVGLASPLPDGVQGGVWARTDADASWVPTIPPLDPNRYAKGPLPGEVVGHQPMVVALAGTFPSAFAGRPLPPRTDPEAPPFEQTELLARSEPTRMIVVGSGDAVANNIDFTLNAIDWLVEDPDLIEVRSRLLADPLLDAPARAEGCRVKLAMVGLPLLALVVVAALARRRG
jgi:ABC-2 type transport system permease protein